MRGYRYFNLTNNGILRGMRTEWDSAVFEAKCIDGDILDCPMESFEEFRAEQKPYSIDYTRRWHGCGIHSFKEMKDLVYEIDDYGVYAEVESYGRVDEFDKGYRSQFCRIMSATFVHPDSYSQEYAEHLAKWVTLRYGVTCGVRSYSNFLEEFATISKPLYSGAWVATQGGWVWQTLGDASNATTTSQSQSKNPSSFRKKRQRVNQKPYQSVNGAKWWDKKLS